MNVLGDLRKFGRIRDVFEGRESGPHADALALGAALALELTGRVPDAGQGLDQARQALADGRAARTLAALAAFFADGTAG